MQKRTGFIFVFFKQMMKIKKGGFVVSLVKKTISLILCLSLLLTVAIGLTTVNAGAAEAEDVAVSGADGTAAQVGANIDAANEGAKVEVQATGSTYYLDVGEDKTLYLDYTSDRIAGSTRWISNAPFDVEVEYYGDTYCHIKVNKYTSFKVIIQATYSYWIKDPLSGVKFRGTKGQDFYVVVNEPPKVTVSFNANGGSVYPTYATVSKGGSLNSLPTPTCSGYSFDGWYTSMYGSTRVSLSRTYDSNTTIYAHWTKKSSSGSSSSSSSSSSAQTKVANPQITSLTPGRAGMTIKWGKVTGASKYRLYYKYAGGSWAKLKDVSGDSTVDANVTYGKKKYYTIRALDSSGKTISGYKAEGWSKVYSVTAPAISSVTSTASGASIKWNKVGDATTYRVYYKEGSGSWKRLGSDVTGTSKVDAGIAYGKTRSYTVRAMNNKGAVMSGYNNTGKKITYGLAKPKISGFTSETNGVSIKWSAVSGASLYRLYIKGSKGWTKIADVKGTSYLYTGAKYGVKNTYTIKCVNAAGKAISPYDSKGTSFTRYLKKPSISGFVDTADGVVVNWSAVSGAEKYRVYVKGSSGWTKLGETTGTSYVNKKAVKGKKELYTIRCVSSDSKTLTSDFNADGWTHTYTGSLATPKFTGYDTSANGITLKWNAVSGAAKYRIYYKNNAGSWAKMVDVTGTSYTDGDIVYGGDYTYTIKCITDDGKYATSGYDKNGMDCTYWSVPEIDYAMYYDGDLYIGLTDFHTSDMYQIYGWTGDDWLYLGTMDSKDDSIEVGNIMSYGGTYTFTVIGFNTATGEADTFYDPDGFTFTV